MSDRYPRGTGRSYDALYGTWNQMLLRCSQPDHISFRRYGGRGIKVCERWQNFENFKEDVGVRPNSEMKLERKDNDGDYTPDNCVWVTPREQNLNRANTIWVVLCGEKMCMEDARKTMRVNPSSIHRRIKHRGETHQQAVDFFVKKLRFKKEEALKAND